MRRQTGFREPIIRKFYSTKTKIIPEEIQVTEVKIQTPNGDTLAGEFIYSTLSLFTEYFVGVYQKVR